MQSANYQALSLRACTRPGCTKEHGNAEVRMSRIREGKPALVIFCVQHGREIY